VPMDRDGELFRISLKDVEPGSHTYHLLVDNVAKPDPHATRTDAAGESVVEVTPGATATNGPLDVTFDQRPGEGTLAVSLHAPEAKAASAIVDGGREVPLSEA